MTNYEYFPKHRKYGIVIKFSDTCYSWSENNKYQRKYLLESKYCDNAVEFYVWENNTTYSSLESFKEYLLNKEDIEYCPLCGKPLKIKKNKNDYFGIFLGCSGWPECKFTKKA